MGGRRLVRPREGGGAFRARASDSLSGDVDSSNFDTTLCRHRAVRARRARAPSKVPARARASGFATPANERARVASGAGTGRWSATVTRSAAPSVRFRDALARRFAHAFTARRGVAIAQAHDRGDLSIEYLVLGRRASPSFRVSLPGREYGRSSTARDESRPPTNKGEHRQARRSIIEFAEFGESMAPRQDAASPDAMAGTVVRSPPRRSAVLRRSLGSSVT